ncbi:hypothetical protein FE783_08775 [Paenibacillus mesophilus]|uniref:ATP-binding protein n=1 Tax=Paenibacillus mesophilus TaxID=2582849 RepID=UPI00110F61F8|nr:ATP-binding protein [Paenibacillus mesophilus]TMV50766.1 hypothetical protein FE783_08775 [Paenibacillus mesophilus]
MSQPNTSHNQAPSAANPQSNHPPRQASSREPVPNGGKYPGNRRTLKKRISRTIHLASFLNIILFSLIMLVVLSFLFKPISAFTANMVSHTIADSMNGETFLKQQGISSLEQFDPNSPGAADWRKTMEDAGKIETYLPLEAKEALEQELDKQHQENTHPGFIINLDASMDVIAIRIEIGQNVIFTNKDNLFMVEGYWIDKLSHFYNIEVSHPLLDPAGKRIGSVTAVVAPQVTVLLFLAAALLFAVLALVATFISKLIGKLVSIPVLTPMEQLNAKIRAMAEGDHESTMNSQIVLNRPLREIEELADGTNRIMQKLQGYNELLHHQKRTLEDQTQILEEQKQTLEDQYEELEAQNDELVRSKQLLQDAQQSLVRSERAIRNVLDNAGQGFLTFGPDTRIDPEYSLECSKIFGKTLEYYTFPELISMGDPEQQRFIESLLAKMFHERDTYKRSIYMPLLTEEIEVNGRHIHIGYKMIPNARDEASEAFMAIFTDITEKREMQSQMEAERNILKMVVKVIVGYGDYTDCVRDFKNFYEIELHELLNGPDALRTKLLNIYRDVHTFKGNFAQFGLTHIVDRLHKLEDELSGLLRDSELLTVAGAAKAAAGWDFRGWLQQDVQVLESVLGESFLVQQDVLMIDKSKIIDIEKKMLALLSPGECKLLLPDLRKLRCKPFKELLKSYPDYVAGLAERMEKLVLPFEIRGEEVVADTERYYDFSRSLIHVFRNIVDHAVEPADERIAAGKEEFGRIDCDIRLEGGNLVLTIRDDGKGIDPDVIRRKALELGVASEEQLVQRSAADIIQLVFSDEFSTKEQVSDISGRGIGLSSVRAEAEKLGGTAIAESTPGVGSVFTFVLPYEDMTGLPEVEFPVMIRPLIDNTKSYFAQFVHTEIEAEDGFHIVSNEKLALKRVTAFMTVKGALEGMFVMTLDDSLAHTLVRSAVLDPLDAAEEEALLEDCLAETANIILGNSFRMFQTFADYMLMEPPITIATEGASVKYADSEIWSCRMCSDKGTLEISFVNMKKWSA